MTIYNNLNNYNVAATELDKISDKLIGGVKEWKQGGATTLTKSGTFNYMTLYTVGGNYSIEEVGNMIAKAHANAIEAEDWLLCAMIIITSLLITLPMLLLSR